ncbi:amino acid transporter [Metschnikowia bicuspidata var. bicuspidata NRRL YB-4993]|uniref:Amino acid transporter n=1 Tax=Metschnikowia bicuspidata var. bicuspidata NRRL YB-4993 TaxID=869754 RepID=A0A1A0HAQ6_9ASCO|nr:amino acid transporter [Metschnikowia bicuspidata var. bicuspidata NRRL YB-4993]OBA20962.1 amino acid transporter [Metschnikowia bicuspidata var. bicuspidata NRRL YB-4993]
MEAVLSKQEVLEAVTSNPQFYNNIQNVQTPHIDPIFSSDDNDLLAQIGYKPELRRQFSAIQVFGVAFSIMGLLPSIASTLGIALLAGPAGAIWGWLISSLLILTIGVSMSENASFQPTSGGLYYWTNFYAPPKLKTIVSFIIGNTNSLALVGGLCSIDYGFATEVLSIVVIAKDGDFEITSAKTYGVFVACVLAHVLVTCASSRHTAWLQTASIIVNVGLIVLFIIAMPIAASRGSPRSASWVFGSFETLTGFPVGWVQLSQAWLPAIWTIGAFDSCVHMSEECTNATRTIPMGIVGSISTCGILGFILMIVIMFSLQSNDLEGVLGSAYGLPMAQIIYDAFETVPGQGKKMAIFFMVLISIAQFMMGASVLTAISRQIFAFARDNGLPFSWWVKKVNKKLSVPIHAVFTGGAAAIVVGLLCLIGDTAANALFTLAVAGNYLAWGMPTFLRLIYMNDKFVPGRFYLGPLWSRVNGWISIVFVVYTIVMVMFPTDTNPTRETMNYTVVLTPGVWILSAVYYYVYAHKSYHGPAKTVDDDGDLSENFAGFTTQVVDGQSVKMRSDSPDLKA